MSDSVQPHRHMYKYHLYINIIYITTSRYSNKSGKESVIFLPLFPEPLKIGEWQREWELMHPKLRMWEEVIWKASSLVFNQISLLWLTVNVVLFPLFGNGHGKIKSENVFKSLKLSGSWATEIRDFIAGEI